MKALIELELEVDRFGPKKINIKFSRKMRRFYAIYSLF